MTGDLPVSVTGSLPSVDIVLEGALPRSRQTRNGDTSKRQASHRWDACLYGRANALIFQESNWETFFL
jgi:hypothetical protein